MANLHPIPSLVHVTAEEHKVQTLLSTYLERTKDTILYLRTKNTLLHLLPTANYYAFNMFFSHTLKPLYIFSRLRAKKVEKRQGTFSGKHTVCLSGQIWKSLWKSWIACGHHWTDPRDVPVLLSSQMAFKSSQKSRQAPDDKWEEALPMGIFWDNVLTLGME